MAGWQWQATAQSRSVFPADQEGPSDQRVEIVSAIRRARSLVELASTAGRGVPMKWPWSTSSHRRASGKLLYRSSDHGAPALCERWRYTSGARNRGGRIGRDVVCVRVVELFDQRADRASRGPYQPTGARRWRRSLIRSGQARLHHRRGPRRPGSRLRLSASLGRARRADGRRPGTTAASCRGQVRHRVGDARIRLKYGLTSPMVDRPRAPMGGCFTAATCEPIAAV